jgi:hypothetical protein
MPKMHRLYYKAYACANGPYSKLNSEEQQVKCKVAARKNRKEKK